MLPVRERQHDFLEAASLRPGCAELVYPDFSTLTAFEHVRDQYRGLGIRFDSAIALHPSNPAFQETLGGLVVMPMAGCSSINVYFSQPRRVIGAVVIGARQVKITACDRQHRPLTRCLTGNRQCKLNEDTVGDSLPQHPLELLAEGIMRVVFESNAPFVLNQFYFG